MEIMFSFIESRKVESISMLSPFPAVIVRTRLNVSRRERRLVRKGGDSRTRKMEFNF